MEGGRKLSICHICHFATSERFFEVGILVWLSAQLNCFSCSLRRYSPLKSQHALSARTRHRYQNCVPALAKFDNVEKKWCIGFSKLFAIELEVNEGVSLLPNSSICIWMTRASLGNNLTNFGLRRVSDVV